MNAKFFCTCCKTKDFAQIFFAQKKKETLFYQENHFGTDLAYR
jgi:hypothetical protein